MGGEEHPGQQAPPGAAPGAAPATSLRRRTAATGTSTATARMLRQKPTARDGAAAPRMRGAEVETAATATMIRQVSPLPTCITEGTGRTYPGW